LSANRPAQHRAMIEQAEKFLSDTPIRLQHQAHRAFVCAFVESLSADARSLGISESHWRLEPLAPHNHMCPVLGFRSRHGCLVPTGVNVWNARELYCLVDWQCSGWCQANGAPQTQFEALDLLERLHAAADPAALCGFRAYIATLQGGFGLPRIQRGQRPAGSDRE